jgi:low affinity Fe/Cu permease
MKKNVIIAVLLITMVLSLIYGFIQKLAAETAQLEAMMQKMRAEKNEVICLKAQKELERMVKDNELQAAQAQKMYEQALAESEATKKKMAIKK